MTPQWKKAGGMGLVEKLQTVADSLNVVLPQIIETQAKSLAAMAEMAVAISGKTSEDNDG